MNHILKCKICQNYTLQAKCPKCSGEAISQIPPKYSPEDKYGKYRREVKAEGLRQKGLL